MRLHAPSLVVLTVVACGGERGVGTASSGTEATTEAASGASGDTTDGGPLEIPCEEASSKAACAMATPPAGMACAWLAIDVVEAPPESD